MLRNRHALIVLAAASLLAWANAGEDQKKRELKGWGTLVDPDGDCEIEQAKGTLTITVPATAHDLGAEHNQMSAPRVLRKMSGDFTAQVLVTGTFQPQGPGTLPDRAPFNGAGLLLWQDENNYIRFERASFVRDGDNRSYYASFEQRKDGQTVRFAEATDLPLRDEDTYVRLERRGDEIHASASHDGKEWQSLEPMKVELPKDVKVGVAVVNTSAKPLKVQFKEFKVTPKDQDKKRE